MTYRTTDENGTTRVLVTDRAVERQLENILAVLLRINAMFRSRNGR